MKKVLITGTCGFIFSNFIRKAIYEKHPYSFVSIDRVNGNPNALYANKNHTFHVADIRDQHVMDTLFQFERPDIVIHGAAESFVDYSLSDPNSFVTSNILGTQVVINSCLKHKVERLIYVSTDEVYGQLTSELDESWTEDAPLNPRNPYCLSGDTKILLDNGCWINISDFKKDNKISSFSFNEMKSVHSEVSDNLNKIGSKLLNIKTEFGSIKCSPQHILFLKRYPREKSGKINYRSLKNNDVKIIENSADQIKVGDFLAFSRKDPVPNNIINIDLELAKFLGYFLGDGNISINSKIKGTQYIKLADQSKDNLIYYSNIIRSFTKRLFGREAKPSFYKHSSKNCWYLSFGCLPLVDIIKKLHFNLYAKDKKIPQEVFSWSNEALFNFLGGLFDADGHYTKNRPMASYCSASLQLLNDIKFLLRRGGILSHDISLSNKEYKGKKYICGKINICDSKSLQLFCQQIKTNKITKNKLSKPQKQLIDDDIIFVRVMEINAENINELLFDLTVPKTSNFIANGFIVHNSATKAAGELLVKAASYSHGLIYNITRSSNNYGPRQTPEKLIPKAIKCIMHNQKIPIYGQGLQIRDWTHVFDNCAALLTVLNDGKPNEIYNISANQEFTNIEVIQKICNAMGTGHNLISNIPDPRKGHDFRYSVNSSKICELGWKPRYKFTEGIIETVDWYKINSWMLR